ncbi:MAG: DUF1700 domain-containing protein [Clostridia bacterium]|nr:DUF1700 domain-containing protein [Clostridia bacterium]
MKKSEFLQALKNKLKGLPKQEVEERINFYSEMIDDRVEEGQSEEQAVLDIGSVDQIAAQIIADIPFSKIAKERVRPKRALGVWEIILLVVGSPIWLSLAVAAFAVILSLYLVLWVIDIALWSVFLSFAVCAVCGVIAGVFLVIFGNKAAGGALCGSGFICAGLTVLIFFGCKAVTVGSVMLTKKIALSIKKSLIKKEKV